MVRSIGKLKAFMIAAIAVSAFSLPTVISAGIGQHMLLTLVIMLVIYAVIILIIKIKH